MIQEDKELLLQDLCCRLPYGVKCRINDECDITVGFTGPSGEVFPNTTGDGYSIYEDIINPYLRPMSSMTEEEKLQLYSHYNKEMVDNLNKTNLGWAIRVCVSDAFGIDWLNSHHFDYRGLIEKGLALEAPEGMYNIN